MRKTQEIKCLRFTFFARTSVFDGKSSELNESGFAFMEFKFELRKTFLQVEQKIIRICFVLETQHKIVGIPNYIHFTLCVSSAPTIRP